MKNFLIKYKTIIGIVISITFLYLSLRKVEFTDILQILRHFNPSIIVFLFLISFVGRLLQTYRWYILLPFTNKRNIKDTFNYLNIGYLLNNILPARIGDFVKSYLLANKLKVSRTDTMASVIVERLFDLTGMGSLFILALLILNLPAYALQGGLILLLICFTGFLALIALAKSSSILSRFQNKYENKNILNWILVKTNKISVYSNLLTDIKLTSVLFFLTSMVWFSYLYSGFLIIENLHPSIYSWQASTLSLLFISISFLIPSTPGNVGVYQYACILAFEVLGVGYTKEEALVFSIISQLPVYLISILLGIYSSYTEGIKVGKLKKYSDKLETIEG